MPRFVVGVLRASATSLGGVESAAAFIVVLVPARADGMAGREQVSFRIVLAPFSPLRVFVTVLLMVSMPLCCCTFRSLGRCCSTVGERQTPVHAETAGDGSEDEHAHCHGGHAHSDAPSGTEPCAPGHGDGNTCACGKSLTKMGVIGKPVIEIPAPALVAILPWPTTPSVESMPSQPANILAARPLVPPATTLLRLHCALTV